MKLQDAAQAVVNAWVDDESGMETFDPALIDQLADALRGAVPEAGSQLDTVRERINDAYDAVYEAIEERTITRAFGDRLLGEVMAIRSGLDAADGAVPEAGSREGLRAAAQAVIDALDAIRDDRGQDEYGEALVALRAALGDTQESREGLRADGPCVCGRETFTSACMDVPTPGDFRRGHGYALGDIQEPRPGVGDGTTTDCPQMGVHDHPFRGPHRFTEWYFGAVPEAGSRPYDDVVAERLKSLPAHAQYPTTAAGRRLLGKNMGNGDLASAEWLANDIWAIESEARGEVHGWPE